ncbi:uncharacterized protein AC631_05481 [Debaryomyces fabryi]|uniref:SURP motif domain-containing protein n=1 Tax=Debaryomyces fabryi TaxID=58627 RepID=A0A0V1PR98_9ASCO|nr:uncharacterized protein AC631_05481 [Debaryomyces fabryi]KRZ98758.1 hypothetical protein AC631_05481 [Debaryomyces fabryi]CUM49254.1 unnamed protein product [Debaryomyces fabryi]
MDDNIIPDGIKIPPAEVKETIDKTVGYVLKNGSSFEERLKNNEGSNEKFTFLKKNDVYNDYYQWKLGNLKDSDVQNGDVKVVTAESTTTNAPLELQFITTNPPISSLDLDIIKLTALFVAKNGKKYAEHLFTHQTQQSNKAQFEFLHEKHSLHLIFQKYVKQYELVLNLYKDSDDDQTQGIVKRLSHPDDIFESAYRRAHYNKQHKAVIQNEKKLEEQKKLAYTSIDWQDFAIVGQIEFDAIDEVRELAIPLRREDLIYRSLESKQKELDLAKAKVQPKQESQETIPEKSENEVLKHPKPKGMKIRAAGESRLKNKSKSNLQTTSHMAGHIKCPITGKFIPELQFDNHLKVLLRDPRYKEQQDNFVRKNFTYSSNLTTDEVYDNIKRLARKREGTQNGEEHISKKPNQIGPH